MPRGVRDENQNAHVALPCHLVEDDVECTCDIFSSVAATLRDDFHDALSDGCNVVRKVVHFKSLSIRVVSVSNEPQAKVAALEPCSDFISCHYGHVSCSIDPPAAEQVEKGEGEGAISSV